MGCSCWRLPTHPTQHCGSEVCPQCRKMTFLHDDCYFPHSYRGLHYSSPFNYRGFGGLYDFWDRYGHDGLYGHWGFCGSRDHYGFGGLNSGHRWLYGDWYGYPSWYGSRHGHHFGSRYGQRYGYWGW
ncbi:keratin-associated protein 21-1-like isoform X1 [Gallus gallus]|uniref:keratin-associated protein 21-1-like isoform X1 n=1 Tax=Gallus gallus TaxID=9031 RepID=UPI000739AC39|nr:keratin-associated protein 21-1-like isoform X1 [Gallus gallus]XP_046788463.1 keratin-associated protein 21-1-like isoform X1 [Gallus gallus]